VRLVVAQRLLARPCPACAGPAQGPDGDPVDCAGCGGRRTRGRSAVAEVLELDPRLRTLLRSGRGPGAHHAALAAAVTPRLRTIALQRAADGLARVEDAVDRTPDVPADA